MKMKRGQEEIVGFVLIVVLVSVVLMIFLGIYIRKVPNDVSESRDIHQFLESSMEYTTECVTSFYPDYRKVGELFKECLGNDKCLDGANSCDVLNESMVSLIDSGWLINEDSPYKGYIFVSEYEAFENSSRTSILSLSSGSCNGSRKGASYLTPASPGTIRSTLEICS